MVIHFTSPGSKLRRQLGNSIKFINRFIAYTRYGPAGQLNEKCNGPLLPRNLHAQISKKVPSARFQNMHEPWAKVHSLALAGYGRHVNQKRSSGGGRRKKIVAKRTRNRLFAPRVSNVVVRAPIRCV